MKKKILITIGIVIVIIVVMGLAGFSIYMDLNKKYDEKNADEDVKMPNIEEYTNIQNDNKNYDINMKIAYENEEDKANSKLVYYNESNKDNYKWNECIIENKAILKNTPEVDFTQFKKLGNEFYSIRISDYELYSKYANDYNLRKLDKSDFDNIFVEFIIRKSPDYSITYKDLVKGYDYISSEDNYTIPVTVGGILDVTEEFKYPCMIGYFPNYFNKDYNDIRFKILALNENVEINKDEAITVAQQYLKNLTYAGCYNFTDMNYVRLENKYANNFLDTDKKIEPIDDTSKEYTVWSISAYSENDMCTSANVYIDVETGKIIGGKLYLATD